MRLAGHAEVAAIVFGIVSIGFLQSSGEFRGFIGDERCDKGLSHRNAKATQNRKYAWA